MLTTVVLSLAAFLGLVAWAGLLLAEPESVRPRPSPPSAEGLLRDARADLRDAGLDQEWIDRYVPLDEPSEVATGSPAKAAPVRSQDGGTFGAWIAGGTTTRFVIGHGLGGVPDTAQVRPLSKDAEAARVITTTATAIVVTYAKAPRKGALIALDWRAERGTALPTKALRQPYATPRLRPRIYR